MAWEEIASGSLMNAAEIERHEARIAEGQRGLLELSLRTPVPDWVVIQLQSRLNQVGVGEAKVSTGSPLLRVSWRKGMSWLAVIIPIIIALLAVLAILIVGWKLFKEIAAVIPQVPLSIGLILALVLGIMVLARRK